MPLSREEKEALGQQDDPLGLSLHRAARRNPDQESKVIQLSEAQRLPRETVRRNLPEVDARHHYRYDPGELRRQWPDTANYLEDEANASVSIDDIDTLTAIEDEMKHGFWSNTMRGALDRINELTGNLIELPGTLSNDLEAAFTTAGIPNPGIKINEDGISWSWDMGQEEELPSVFKYVGKAVSEGSGYGYQPNFTWERFKGEMTPTNLAGYVVEQGVRSIPDMIATLTTLPAYVASRTEEIAESRAENDGRSDASTGDLVNSVATATAVSLIERLGAKSVFDIGGARTLKDIAKAGGLAFIKEGVTEFAQEGLEYYGETIGTDKPVSHLEALDRAIAGAVAGGPFGGGIRTTTAGIEVGARALGRRAARDVERVTQELVEQDTLDRMIRLFQDSRTRERAQERFRRFLAGPARDRAVYVDPAAVADLNAQGVEMPGWLAGSTVTEGGVDIEIPMEQFATEIATNEELLNSLRPFLRLSPTFDARPDLQTLIDRALQDRETKSEADQIFESVKDQLVETGRMSDQTARYAAQLIPARATVLAQQQGISVAQAYQKMGFRVVGPSGLQREEDFVTLYRGEVEGDFPFDPMGQGEGQWWTQDRDMAERFGEGGRVEQIKIPKSKQLQLVEFVGKEGNITDTRPVEEGIAELERILGPSPRTKRIVDFMRAGSETESLLTAEDYRKIREAGYVSVAGANIEGTTDYLLAPADQFDKEPITTLQQAQRNNIGLYSAVEQAAEEVNLPEWKPRKDGTAGSARGSVIWQKIQKQPGVKKEELEWLGLEEFLNPYQGAQLSLKTHEVVPAETEGQFRIAIRDDAPLVGDEAVSGLGPIAGIRFNSEQEAQKFLKTGGALSFTRDQVTAFIRRNGVQVEEIIGEQEARPDIDIEWSSLETITDEAEYEDEINAELDEWRDDSTIATAETEEQTWQAWQDDWVQENFNEILDHYRNLVTPEAYEQLVALEDERQRLSPGNFSYEVEQWVSRYDQDFEPREALQELAKEDARAVAVDKVMEEPIEVFEARWNRQAEGLLDFEDLGVFIRGNDRQGWQILIGETPETAEPTAARIFDNRGEAEINADELVRNRAEERAEMLTDYEDEMDSTVARWEQYRAEGEYDDYMEIKLRLPEIEPEFWYDVHFPEPNILVFMRVSDRAPDFDNSPGVESLMFHIEELQSDWHQQGRKRGYQDDTGEVSQQQIDALVNERKQISDRYRDRGVEIALDWFKGFDDFDENEALREYRAAMSQIAQSPDGNYGGGNPGFVRRVRDAISDDDAERLIELYREIGDLTEQQQDRRNVIPDAPFKGDNYLMLAMKRMLIHAVEKGYDQLSWNDAQTISQQIWRGQPVSVYDTQYDNKMPSVIKKLTGQKPRHLTQEGEPMPDPGEAQPHRLALSRNVALIRFREGEEVWIDNPNNIAKSEEQINDQPPGTDFGQTVMRVPEMRDPGYWVIDLTPELKERIREEGFSLFQEGDRGELQIFDNERIIKLGRASDLSTFLHEAGHLFLEIEKQLVQESGEITEDQQTILDYLEAESFDEVVANTKEGREKHEKFARSFEAYLMEGKSPSLKLRDAFAAFKRWLIRIYQSIANLDVELTDDIRQVFDRMLATQAEIMEASANPIYDQYFQSQEQAGMTDEEWQRYQKNRERREARATENVDEKLIEEWRRRREREWNEERSELYEEEVERLAAESLYRLTADLNDAPMDYELVREALGNPQRLPGRLIGKARKEDGVDPQEYAEAYGFSSVDEMLDALVNQPTLQQAAMDAAQNRMIEKYGDILNDGTLELEVQEALQNDVQAELLLQEIRALNRSAPAINRDYLKAEAKRIISGMTYKQIQPNKYYRAEMRAAQRAAQATGANEAYDAKVQQLVNHYLYREAVATRKAMKLQQRYVRQVVTRDYDNKAVHPRFSQNMKALANLYQLQSPQARRTEVDVWLNWFITQAQDPNRYLDLALHDPILVEALQAKQDGRLEQFEIPAFDDLSADQLRGLYEMIRHLRYVGGQTADRVNQEVQGQRNAFTNSIIENGGEDIDRVEHRREGGWADIRFLANTMPSLKNLTRMLDGTFEGDRAEEGMAERLLLKPILDAENRRLRLSNDVRKEFEQELGDVWRLGFSRRNRTVQLDNGRKVPFNDFEIFVLGLYWGTETSRDAVREGGAGMTDNDVMRLLGMLSTEQLELLNHVWRLNEYLWPQLSEASVKRYGVAPVKLDPAPFEVKGVQLTGGHMRLFYNSLEQELREEREQGATMGTMLTTKAGSLYERTGSGGKPVLLEISNIVRNLEENIHFIAFAETSQQVRRIINAPLVQEAITQKHGRQFLRALIENLDGMLRSKARPIGPVAQTISKYVRILRHAATMKHLVGSIRNIVQQTTAFPLAVAEVGPVNYWNAVWEMATNPIQIRDYIKAKSDFMYNRTSLVNREAAMMFKKMEVTGRAGHIYNTMKDYGFYPQTAIDSLVAYPTWYAKFKSELDQHGDEERAIRNADIAVSESVGSGLDSHLGTVFSSKSNEITLFFTIFGSWFNAYYQRMYRSSYGFKKPTPASVMTIFVTPFILGLATAALVMDIPDDDSDEGWGEWMATRYLAFLAGTIPIVRDFVSANLLGYRPKTVMGGAIESPQYLAGEIRKLIEEDRNATALSVGKTALDVGSTFIPIPGAGQMVRVADYVDAYNQGKEQQFNAYQMLVEGTDKND